MFRKSGMGLAIFLALANNVAVASPSVWVTPIQGGEMRFYDWGYKDGLHGRGAYDFSPINSGFGGLSEGNLSDPLGGVGQMQHVVTRTPDNLTLDPSVNIYQELSNAPLYNDANMDGRVNFYKWGYTTKAGSTFDPMFIDLDGDYMVPRDAMNFVMYDIFNYKNEGASPLVGDGEYASTIVFQPYPLSDAKGWCGSVVASNPAALEPMAGQVSFDFGFEVFFNWNVPTPGAGAMQIIPGFNMRSYGSIEIDISLANGGQGDIYYAADAVVNNTSPLDSTVTAPDLIEVPVLKLDGTPALDGLGQPRIMMLPQKEVGGGGVDPAYNNLVSFMGAGIIPEDAWVLVDVASNIQSTATGSLLIRNDQIIKVVDGGGNSANMPAVPTDPVTGLDLGKWMFHKNFYKGYTFILRADGIRVVDAIDYSHYSNLDNVLNQIAGVAYNNDENGVLQAIADISDRDKDGIYDSADNCPGTSNPDQKDSGGVDTNTPDGIGDVCQCGDINGNGKITNTDSVLMKRHLLGLPSNFDADFCDVNGDGQCTNTDAVIIKRSLLGLPPGLQQTCTAAGN